MACCEKPDTCYCDMKRPVHCQVCEKDGITFCYADSCLNVCCGDCAEKILDRVMETRANAASDPDAPYVSTSEHATLESLLAKLEKIEKGEELSTPVVCPECGEGFKVRCASEHDMWGATLDCTHCGALLIADSKSKTIKNFHKHIHEENPIWPADGKGCGSIER